MSDTQLHKTQMSILHSLRYAESERFNALMHATDHTSDTFKFHLRKLVKSGYVEKSADGRYRLTASGKEYANNLNERQRVTEKQPKISVLAVVTKQSGSGQVQYLVQKRSRNPYFGYVSEIHGRAVWGEHFEDTARRQLLRQTGLDARFTVHGFRHVRDFDAASHALLEDKLFVITRASSVSGEPTNDYPGGVNVWMTLDELRTQPKVFATTLSIIESLDSDGCYRADDLTYDGDDY